MATRKSIFENQARSITLLWGEGEQPTRGPKPGLSVQRVTHAAVEIADTEGLAAVSMQRVARTFGFTTMSLYRYVPGKAELIHLMLDRALGTPPKPAPDTVGWRAALEEWSWRMWEVFRCHPWILEVSVGHRVMGPHELDWLESALTALNGTRLDGAEMLDTVVTLNGHLRSIAQQTLQTADGGTPSSDSQMSSTMAELVQGRGERYPALTAALESAEPSPSQNDAIAFGLRRILDGLDLLITQRDH